MRALDLGRVFSQPRGWVAQQLKANPFLEELHVSEASEVIHDLQEYLENNPYLTSITISCTIRDFSWLFYGFPNLTSIALPGCGLLDDVVVIICQLIEQHAIVSYLDLSRNSFGYEGTNAITRLLSHNVSLKYLYLTRCPHICLALGGLFEQLHSTQVLEFLDVSGLNRASNMLEYFPPDSSLKRLVISKNSIPIKHVEKFANVLSHNRNLEFLNMLDVLHSRREQEQILRLLEKNASLMNIHMGIPTTDLTDRNQQAYALCKETLLYVLWAGRYFLGRDVARIIALELWKSRKTLVWVQKKDSFKELKEDANPFRRVNKKR